MKKILALLVVTILVVGAASCATLETEARDRAAPAKLISTPTTAAAAPAEPLKACLVTDSAGIGDKSFNDAVWGGLESAMTDFGIEANYIESKSADDYAPNLEACVDSEPDVIVCVGFLMADACEASVSENPDINYIGIDVFPAGSYDNFLGVDALMDQSCFLAGYLAAGMTETGTVATYTGFAGPVVWIFMDGFYSGVQEYNAVHGTDVQVLGYDPEDPDSASAIGSWIDVDLGRQITESFMDNGADIVLAVAGNVGTGSAAVMEERGYGYTFGVDQDWTITNSQYSDQILASMLKKMAIPVYDAVKGLVEEGKWEGGYYILTLENSGTELVYNDAIDVPADLKAEIDALASRIISGELPSLSPQYLELYPRE